LQAFAHPHLDALVQAQSKKHALSSSDHAVSSASAAVASTADDDAAGDPTLPLEAGADDAAKHSAKRPRLDADGFAVPSAVESRPTISLPTSVTEIDWAHIKLGALIGKGAMGAVNRAAYAMPDSDGVVLDVAVKQLHQSADGELPQKEIDRFRSELILLSRLKHDNIVKCFGGILSSSATSPLAIVMEYVGETLKRRISRSGGLVGKLALADLVEISTGMARGIAFLHAQAIIHRDVKPGNCLLLGNVAKLCDFGISRAHEGTSAMTRIGTPTFMAPEVLRGEAYSTKADIYSMGMILWQMTSAEQPFGKPGAGDGDGDAADAFNVIMKAAVQHSRPDFLPITPAPLVELIDACWHRVPAARPCADELVAALEAIDTSN
jgi:serine/threonine protein kinase